MPIISKMHGIAKFKHHRIFTHSFGGIELKAIMQQACYSYFLSHSMHFRGLNTMASLPLQFREKEESQKSSLSSNYFRKTFNKASEKHFFLNQRNYGNAKFYKPDNEERKYNSSLLETWSYEVSPYGSFKVYTPLQTVIKPLNPQDYPDMNKCIIELCFKPDTSSDNNPDPHQLSRISDLYKMDVSFDKDKGNINVSCDPISDYNIPVCCYLQVPLKADLSVEMIGDKSISVENMESNSIKIETKKGDVHLRKLKCGSVSAITHSGDIISKSTLLGNVNLHCGGSGMISADKLQGSSMTCSTEMGAIDVKSLYSERATFKTIVGDVNLGQCHGQLCIVGEKSDLVIGSLDGDLDAGLQQGSVNAMLSRHNKVDIDLNTGDIGISFPEGARTDLTLSCPSVTVADNLPVHFDDTDMPHYKEGYIGERGCAKLNARTLSGTIHLSILDWIQTTKLAFMDKVDNP